MPIYEYRCNACEHQFDAIQKFSDAPLSDCPACGEAKLRKLLSAPSFQLKGTGWYETDFKGKKKKESGDGAADGPKSETKSDNKSDSKSDSKSESKSSDAKGSGESKSSSGSGKEAPKSSSSPAAASD